MLLFNVIRHQNIIGWDNFLRGYTSSHWLSVFQQSHSCDTVHQSLNWDKILVEGPIKVSKQILSDRNTHLHGSSKLETEHKLREWILQQVSQVYAHPPRLQKHFSKIKIIPLLDRLKHSTTNLQLWLARINHQTYVSNILHSNKKADQLSLLNAYWHADIHSPDR
jgi:hypothetical protein